MASYNQDEDINVILARLEELNISFKDKSVFITGGAGFIGSWICDILIKQGAIVTCIDNLFSGRIENIERLMDHDNLHVQISETDLSQPLHCILTDLIHSSYHCLLM